jgi:hypothetical protein
MTEVTKDQLDLRTKDFKNKQKAFDICLIIQRLQNAALVSIVSDFCNKELFLTFAEEAYEEMKKTFEEIKDLQKTNQELSKE